MPLNLYVLSIGFYDTLAMPTVVFPFCKNFMAIRCLYPSFTILYSILKDSLKYLTALCKHETSSMVLSVLELALILILVLKSYEALPVKLTFLETALIADRVKKIVYFSLSIKQLILKLSLINILRMVKFSFHLLTLSEISLKSQLFFS